MICGTTFLAIICGTVLTLVSTVRGANLCPKCTEQHINLTSAVPGKCDECWPCELIECHEGLGSSVACGTTVSHGTDISCVACVSGVNFSDSSGSGQCQPCGTCTGKYEYVLLDCNPEHNVKCECKDAFYRNTTTKECLPCASCCAGDGNIEERCRSDGGEIGNKCKFKELWPKICLSSSTAVNTNASMTKLQLSVVTTSSSLMTSSFSQTTATPLLHSIHTAIAPTLSETVQIKVTLSSVSGYGRQSNVLLVSSTNINIVEPNEKKKNRDETDEISHKIVIPLLSALFVAFFVLIVRCAICNCIMKRKLRKISINNQGTPEMKYSELEAARENEDREISECSGASEPLLKGEEDPYGIASLPLEIVETTCGNYAGLSKGLMLVNMPEEKMVSVQLPKGIPTSLDSGPRNQGQRPRKHIPSEGDDKSDPCLEGYTDNHQDESVTVTVHKMTHPSVPPAALSNTRKPNSSSSNNVVSSSLATSSLSNAEQMSGISQVQSNNGNANHDQVAICPLIEPPIQSTEDNRGYFTHINDVPESVIHDICMLLDIERDIDGKDYKMLASELGVKPARIRYLKELQKQSGKSPSYGLITQVFASRANSGTLKHLCSILERMERHDVIKVIDDWVSNNP